MQVEKARNLLIEVLGSVNFGSKVVMYRISLILSFITEKSPRSGDGVSENEGESEAFHFPHPFLEGFPREERMIPLKGGIFAFPFI
jgi:hypothetical protein